MNGDHLVDEAIRKMGLTEEESRKRYQTDPLYRATIDSIAHGADIHTLYIQVLDSHNKLQTDFEN